MKKTLVGVISLLVSILAFQLIWFKDWGLTAIVISAVYLHELAHAAVLWAYGVRSSMIFIPFLGAAVTPSDGGRLMRYGDHIERANVAIAGPVVNFVLMIIGGVWYLFTRDNYAAAMMAINASLTYFNMLPLLIFDGKRVFSALFDSLDEAGDKRLVKIVTPIAFLVGLATIVLGGANFFYIAIVFALANDSKNDDPNEAYSPRAMTKAQSNKILLWACVLLFVGMLVSAVSPNWVALFGVWPAK